MIKGLHTSASGMIPHIKKQELAANNIANASTPGFKKDSIFTKELSRAEKKLQPTKSDWQQPMIDQIYTDYSAGIFNKTGNPLDIAIEGDGFFALESEGGTTVLTTSGSFTVDSEGFLSLPGGLRVIGETGPIEVGNGKVTVALTGEVEVDGINVARLVPRTVADLSKLEKIGSSMFAVPEGMELLVVEKANLRQGFLEASNVDIVREMIDMIVSFRSYEANARAIQTQDQSLGHLFNRVAGK